MFGLNNKFAHNACHAKTVFFLRYYYFDHTIYTYRQYWYYILYKADDDGWRSFACRSRPSVVFCGSLKRKRIIPRGIKLLTAGCIINTSAQCVHSATINLSFICFAICSWIFWAFIVEPNDRVFNYSSMVKIRIKKPTANGFVRVKIRSDFFHDSKTRKK